MCDLNGFIENDDIAFMKIKNDKYDFDTALDIISQIFISESPENLDITCFFSFNTFSDFDDDVQGSIAYTESVDKNNSLIFFDIQSFMEVFGNNVKNEHNYSFEDANRYFLNTSNNYFKILEVFYHELEHVNQSIKSYSLYDTFFSNNMLFDKNILEFAIIYFDCFLKHPSYIFSLLEHAAYIEGTYKAIKFFEENNLEQFLKIDKFKIFMDRLFSGYSILDKKIISPYDKLVEKQNDELSKKSRLAKEIIDLNFDILDYGKLFFYGLPVEYDVFMELKNLDNLNYDSISCVKKYIKKL